MPAIVSRFTARQLVVALLLFGVVALMPVVSSSPQPAYALTNCSVNDLSIDSEENAFLTLINNLRAGQSVAPLTMSANLNRAASWMAWDLATRSDGVFSHTDSSGRAWNVRLQNCDVPASSLGENIAGGYTTAQQVYDGWFASSGHYANMTSGAFVQIGIARYLKPSGAWYWVTDFGAPNDGTTVGGGSPPPPPPPTKANITSPSPGSTLAGSSATFTRDNGSQVSAYSLWVGTALGSYNVFSGYMNATSLTVNGLPTNGSSVYVRLWSYFSATGWQYNDYTFTAQAGAPVKAVILSPASGSVLPGSSAAFTRDNGSQVSAYSLWVGTAPGSYNVFSGYMNTTSLTVNGLPTNGSPVYVRLWSYFSTTGWQYNDYTYTAASSTPVKAAIVSPAAGTTLPGSSVTFTRNSGSQVVSYSLWVGSTPGSYSIFSGYMSSPSQLVSGIPTNGAPVYVRLWSYFNATGWQYNDYTYTASP